MALKIRFHLFLAFTLLASTLNAQFGRTAKSPSLGDIIKYERRPFGEVYGLVVQVETGKIDVEFVERSGQLEKTFLILSPTFSWEMVDAFKKAPGRKLRSWSSSDGKFQIKAKMLRVEGDKVRLEKDNGKSIVVPIAKLGKRDRDYIASSESSTTPASDNPFDVTESADLPNEVVLLLDRRRELMVEDERHRRLAKLHPDLLVGDIIKFEKFPSGRGYGIVASLGIHGVVESIDDDGELTEARGFNRSTSWTFYDRELVTMPLKERKWKSANGKFEIHATLIGIDDDDRLSLKKSDGSTVNVPKSKLSDIDQKYAARNLGKLKISHDEQLIRERETYNDDLQRLLVRRNELLKREIANRLVTKDASKMKAIRLNTQSIGLGPERMRPLGTRQHPFSLQFSVRVPKNARTQNVCFASQANVVAFAASSPFHGKPTLVVANIDSQDVFTNEDSAELGHDAVLVAMSPTAKTMIVYSESGTFDYQLELWQRDGDRLSQINVISYESRRKPTAHLFSDESGVILSSDDNLVFFDIRDRIIPTHQIAANRRSFGKTSFQISQDQKSVFLFDSAKPAIYVVDAESKTCVGGLKLEQSQGRFPSSFAQINADGKTASHFSGQQLKHYSLETGEVIEQLELPDHAHSVAIRMKGMLLLASNLVLDAGNNIVDLNLGMRIGRITNSGFFSDQQVHADVSRIFAKLDNRSSAGVGGFGNVIGFSSGSNGGSPMSSVKDRRSRGKYGMAHADVRSQTLPVDEIVSHANSLSESDIIDFGTGDTLQIDVKLDGPSNIETQLRSKIKTKMSEGGIEIANRSDYKLKLVYSVGKPIKKTYEIVGGIKPRTRNVTFVPKSCSAQLMYRGEVIWSRGQSASLGIPFDEGELDDSLNHSKKMSARTLLDFDYPNELRVISPSKIGQFEWE